VGVRWFGLSLVSPINIVPSAPDEDKKQSGVVVEGVVDLVVVGEVEADVVGDVEGVVLVVRILRTN